MRTENFFTSRASPRSIIFPSSSSNRVQLLRCSIWLVLPAVFFGSVGTTGQCCISTRRLYLHYTWGLSTPCQLCSPATCGCCSVLCSRALRSTFSFGGIKHCGHADYLFFSSGSSGVSSGRYVDLVSPLNGSNFVLKPLAPHAQLQIQIQVQSCVQV